MSTSLRGKKVLITAGPTREYWDPVRYLTNSSSGAMGIALAEEARRRGAHVTLVLGPTFLQASTKIKTVPVVSGWEMYEAVKKQLKNTDFFIGAAAVVDYRPAQSLKSKIKHHQPTMTLRLQGNPDIIAMVGHLARSRPAQVVGFALETDHLLENAREKLLRKRMDWIVANRETNMGASKGSGTILSRWGHQVSFNALPKPKLAEKIWQTILSDN